MSENGAVVASAPPRDHGQRLTIARNAVNLVIGQVTTTALAIVFSAVLGRKLGAGDFGLYFLASTFANFAYVVVDWGQQFYVIREVARAPERGGGLLGTSMAMRAAAAALLSIPAAGVAWALGYDGRTRWFCMAFIAANLPLCLSQAVGFVFRGRDRMGLDSAVSVVNKAAILALAIPALVAGLGVGGVAAAQGIAGGIALAVALRLYRRVASDPVRPTVQTAREVFAGGSAIVTMMVAVAVQPYLDAILLSKMVPAAAMGWFGAARNIMGTLLAPSLILGAATFPGLSRAAGDMPAFQREVRLGLRPMLFLGALAGVGTWLFADDAIGLVYGHRGFAPAGAILKIYGPGLFLVFVDVLLGNALTALNRATAFSIAKVASVVLSTGLDLLLIPRFQAAYGNGGMGATTSFVASEIVVFAGSMLIMPRGSMGFDTLVDVFRALGAAGATALVMHFAPAVPFYVGIPACCVVFALCSLALGLLRRGDLHLFQALLRKQGQRQTTAA